MEDIKFLENVCLQAAPSGREMLIYPILKETFESFGEISEGKLNNLVIKKKGTGYKSIMLMAHADEVFMVVTEFKEGGFLKFKPVGLDVKVLPSQEVIIHGKTDIKGIIGAKPPHLLTEEDRKRVIPFEELVIDTGLSNEALSEVVSVGDFITLTPNFKRLLNDRVSCKSIDDRAGIAALYRCAKELSNVNHDLDVYFAISCEEEVGHRGAKACTYEINPDMAIAIDVTFDNGPFGDSDRENKIGGGPVICVGPNIHPRLREKLMSIARDNNIPFNVEVEPGNTGTDAWDIQIVRRGIPTLLVSIPMKYMHTRVEVISMEDIKNTGKLIAKFIQSIDGKELSDLLCF